MFHFYWDRKNKTIIGLWLFDDAEVEAGWWVQRHFDSEKMYRHFLQISNFIIFWRKRSVFNHLSKTSFRLTTSKKSFWVAILDQFCPVFEQILNIVVHSAVWQQGQCSFSSKWALPSTGNETQHSVLRADGTRKKLS